MEDDNRLRDIERYYLQRQLEPSSLRSAFQDVEFLLFKLKAAAQDRDRYRQLSHKHMDRVLEYEQRIVELEHYLKGVLTWAEAQPKETLFAVRQLLNEYLVEDKP